MYDSVWDSHEHLADMAVNARKESIVPDLSKKFFRANYPKLLSTGKGGGGGRG